MADALGNTFTTYYKTQSIDGDFYNELSADVWVAPVYLNAATGQNFTSWPEFFAPHPENGDFFTTPQRNNLSSIIFDVYATGDNDRSNGIVVYGYANRTSTSPQPFPANQIVLLTDAFCSSACATFVELMHHQAGVRTVVAGGRPENGPMQAVGGTRGAQSYTSVALDQDIAVAEILNSSVTDVLPDRHVGNYINFVGFNIKDAIRPGESFPLQFAYEAATCRIFYTQRTVYNYLNLWNYVVDAIWRNPSLCIDGSANGTTILPTNTTGPANNQKEITAANDQDIANIILTGLSSGPQLPQPSQLPKRDTPSPTTLHDALSSHHLSNHLNDGQINVDDCAACGSRPGFICAPVPVCVQGARQTQKTCVRACQKGGATCVTGETCYFDSGPGFCVAARLTLQLADCKTPTSSIPPQTTKAVGDGNFNLPFGRQPRRMVRAGG